MYHIHRPIIIPISKTTMPLTSLSATSSISLLYIIFVVLHTTSPVYILLTSSRTLSLSLLCITSYIIPPFLFFHFFRNWPSTIRPVSAHPAKDNFYEYFVVVLIYFMMSLSLARWPDDFMKKLKDSVKFFFSNQVLEMSKFRNFIRPSGQGVSIHKLLLLLSTLFL